MRRFLIFPLMFISLTAFSQQHSKDSMKTKNLDEVTITFSKNVYKVDSSNTVSKMPLKYLENPQVYNTISKTVIKDQVITNLNSALKNATGIIRLWESTGRGSDGAEYYSLRGFSVQPTMMNGMPNINNGTIDPVNIENVEVIKGPSGTLYGSSLIAYGGLINIVTKKPFETFGGEVGYVAGSNSLNRFTADVNTPLSKNVFARVVSAYTYQKSFQNAGFGKSFYIAPSLKVKANEKLTFFINTEFKNSENAAVPMYFLNRGLPLSFHSMDLFEKNYMKSYTNNGLSIRNPSFGIQTQAQYKLDKNWTSQTILSSSHTQSSGYYQYLNDMGNGDQFMRYISKQNSETSSMDIQQNFIGDYSFGKMRNKVLVGVDYFRSQVEDYGTGWVANGKVSLVNQTDSGKLSTQAVDNLLAATAAGNSVALTKVFSAYISDVIYFTPKLSAMLSLRMDNFQGNPARFTDKAQMAFSPKFGLVYQPILDKLSLFANYMNGFSNLAPVKVTDINGNNPELKSLDPEQANQWETGFKANIYKDKISLTASYYNILVSNKAMKDPDNINNTIQGGEVESKGYEISLVTSPIEGLSIIAGYSHNDNQITNDIASGDYKGMRSESAGPADLINFWGMYRFQQKALRGFKIGFGANYVGENKVFNRKNLGTFVLPSYTLLNGLVSYSAKTYDLSLKMDNITDTKSYGGWSTISPQGLRTLSVALNYKF